MNSSFPLYDNMMNGLPKKKLLIKEKKDLVVNIGKLDNQGMNLVYTLIRYYFNNSEQEDNNRNCCLPYEGEFINEDIQFDLEKFPLELNQLLFKFVKLHLQKMKEDEIVSHCS